ncbi:hypothetical protein AGR2A_Cc110264 [Agrobacterium genomosp. 2 str. CFBP 5494]|uniref:Uncharacterized protein n=1 Tax=Agrobacterium genomosp. 2 str. CFBP 5494 TaxID=1183436 RepID=A0A9W5EZ05_9HYPH|nr:hypothetical protein AGR2A_Cc110264 [Agrobacterium genomosp. 2 str. CFBP 5494]
MAVGKSIFPEALLIVAPGADAGAILRASLVSYQSEPGSLCFDSRPMMFGC